MNDRPSFSCVDWKVGSKTTSTGPTRPSHCRLAACAGWWGSRFTAPCLGARDGWKMKDQTSITLCCKSIRTHTTETFNLDRETAHRSHRIDFLFLAGVEDVEQMKKWLDFQQTRDRWVFGQSCPSSIPCTPFKGESNDASSTFLWQSFTDECHIHLPGC